MPIFKKNFFHLFLILSLIVVLGAGCNPFQKKPEEVLRKMTGAMGIVQSNAFNFQVKVNTPKSQYSSEGQLELSFSGKLSGKTPQDIKSQVNLDSKFSSSAQNISVAAEFRTINQKTYFQLTELSIIPNMNLDQWKNQWYSLDQAQVTQDLKNINLNVNAPTVQLTEEQISQIKDLVKNTTFFQVTEVLKDEKIKDVKSYHYKVMLSRDGLIKFIEGLVKIFNQTISPELQKNLNEQLDKISSWTGEIWIGKKDYYLRQVKVNGSFPQDGDSQSVTFELAFILSDFDQPVDVAVPEKSSVFDLQKILESMMPKLPTNTNINSSVQDLKKDGDNDGLSDYIESFYQTDPENPDTDKDGYKDGEEVLNGYNPKGQGKLELNINF